MSPSHAIRAFLQSLADDVGFDYPPTDLRSKAQFSRLLHHRLQTLYSFLDRDPSQDRVQRLFARFCGESARQLLFLDSLEPSPLQAPDPSTLEIFSDRPPITPTFDQLFCTPDSTERRVRAILEVTPPQGRVLFVGDDDLSSLLLAQSFQGEIHVIDLDDRLLQFLASKAPSLQLHKIDLILGGVPTSMERAFDTVILDPPWDFPGAWAFLSRALFCLRSEPHARILLAFCPVQMELFGSQMARFWRSLSRSGFACESLRRAFHLYDLTPMSSPDYLRAFHLRLPTAESPLMDRLRSVPYTFSHLYELRRIPNARIHPLRSFFSRWWLRSRSNSLPLSNPMSPSNPNLPRVTGLQTSGRDVASLRSAEPRSSSLRSASPHSSALRLALVGVEAEPSSSLSQELPNRLPFPLQRRFLILDYLRRLLLALGVEVPEGAEALEAALPSLYPVAGRRLRETIQRLQTYQRSLQRTLWLSRIRPVGSREETALRIFGECSLALLAWAAQGKLSALAPSAAFEDLCRDRPKAILRYDQLFCSPDSTERRVDRVLRSLAPQGRCLFLGDDDLGSLALRLRHPGPIDVIEYDERLLTMIHEKADDIGLWKVDLFLQGLPRPLFDTFDAVILDPPWDLYHAWCFLHKALLALRKTPEARLFLSFCPFHIEHLQSQAIPFWTRISSHGLILEEILPAFHLYPLRGTEFFDLLLRFLPPLESPLLEAFPHLPFGISNLYILRRDQGYRPSPLRLGLQRLWHLASSAPALLQPWRPASSPQGNPL